MSTNFHRYLQNKLPFYLDTLKQMVSINSFTDNADGVNALGNLTAEVFAELGFTAKRVQADTPTFGKHLVMTRPNAPENAPVIGLVSHLDTVFPPEEEIQNNFSWREEGDRIYGPGTVDIKGGTVGMFMLLDALKALAQQTFENVNWVLLLNAAEERLSRDFGRLCLERLPNNTLAALVFEGGRMQNNTFSLVVTRKGRAQYTVKTFGKSAHAGNNHHLGANAVLQMAYTVQQIAALTNYDHHLTFNVGVIKGGSVVNRVPHYAETAVEMRAFSGKVFDKGVEKILALNGPGRVTSADGSYTCRVEVELHCQTPPWSHNPATNHLYALWEAAARELGAQTTPDNRGGLSDGNLIWRAIPTLDGLGPSGANAHSAEHNPDENKEQEYVLASSFVPKTVLNLNAILKLLST